MFQTLGLLMEVAMAGRGDPTDELISYLETRLEADGLDYREAVMIEDLMASLSRLQGSVAADPRERGPAHVEPFCNGTETQGPRPEAPKP